MEYFLASERLVNLPQQQLLPQHMESMREAFGASRCTDRHASVTAHLRVALAAAQPCRRGPPHCAWKGQQQQQQSTIRA